MVSTIAVFSVNSPQFVDLSLAMQTFIILFCCPIISLKWSLMIVLPGLHVINELAKA